MTAFAAAIPTSTRTVNDVPADYHGLYEQFMGLVMRTVIDGGIDPQDARDVAHDILCRVIERDLLPAYDPTLRHDTPSGQRTARFATWLAAVVKAYLPHHRTRQKRHTTREGTPLVRTDDEGTEFPIHDAIVADHADAIAERDAHDRVVRILDDVPVRGTRDLARAMRILAAQVEAEGRISRRHLAAEMGVSVNTAQNIIADVIDHLTARGLTPAAFAPAARIPDTYAA